MILINGGVDMRKTDKSSGLILLFLILLLIITGSVLLFFQLRSDKVSDLLEKQDVITLLLVISDGEEVVSSQVFLYSKLTAKGALIDIPPHTGSILESEGRIGSIGGLYEAKNIDPFSDKIAGIIGQEIDFSLHFSLDSLLKMIDLVEGIEIFIPNPVEQIEPDDIILLPSGNLVLDGSKSVTFLTFFEASDSYNDRANRNQKLIQGLIKSMGSQAATLVHEKTQNYVEDLIHSDVSGKGLSVLFGELNRLDSERMVLLGLRGTVRNVDGKELLFPHSDGKLIRETIRQTIESLSNEEILSDEELNISIEILNGTNRNGLASRTSQIFQSFGYEVKAIGNADSVYEKTVIIDHRGDLPNAQRLAKIIHCTNIQSDSQEEALADVEEISPTDITIILGKDFDGRYCK